MPIPESSHPSPESDPAIALTKAHGDLAVAQGELIAAINLLKQPAPDHQAIRNTLKSAIAATAESGKTQAQTYTKLKA